MGKKLVFCYEVDFWDCCSSCHNEWDEGYGGQMESDLGKNYLFLHCCSSDQRNFIDLDDKDMQLKILKSIRKFRNEGRDQNNE